MAPLTNPQIRALKAQAQRLKATLKIGKEGVSPQFLAALDLELDWHGQFYGALRHFCRR